MKKTYIYILSILIIAFGLITISLYSVLYSPNTIVKNKNSYVDIPKNTDFDALKTLLKPYLKSTSKFSLASKIKRFHKIYPGRYQIKNKMNNNDLINILRIGKQVEINVTFNNRNSLKDLAGAVSLYIASDSNSILKTILNQDFLRKNGFNQQTALLMYVPNTYKMYYNTSPEKFRNKMLKEYHRFWNNQRRAQAKALGLTPIEVGILASIIQKESTKKEELPRIAGVYLNRLKKHMLLQADPTVVFAYQQKYGKDIVIKRVLNKHKEVVSAYNTYKNIGLPLGPICMPDQRSINAVLQPEKHNFYYFVADFNKPGYHIFNKNLSGHNRDAGNYHTQLNRQGIYH